MKSAVKSRGVSSFFGVFGLLKLLLATFLVMSLAFSACRSGKRGNFYRTKNLPETFPFDKAGNYRPDWVRSAERGSPIFVKSSKDSKDSAKIAKEEKKRLEKLTKARKKREKEERERQEKLAKERKKEMERLAKIRAKQLDEAKKRARKTTQVTKRTSYTPEPLPKFQPSYQAYQPPSDAEQERIKVQQNRIRLERERLETERRRLEVERQKFYAEQRKKSVPKPSPKPKPSPSPKPSPQVLPNSSFFYTVKKGDTLWSISQRHKLKVEDLQKANNLNSNLIRSGQKLLIPKR